MMVNRLMTVHVSLKSLAFAKVKIAGAYLVAGELWSLMVTEVLALSAGHALMALLADAGRCLALSVRMASSAEDEASPSPYESPLPRETSISMLPDLTERSWAESYAEMQGAQTNRRNP